jgi:phospholipid/cholesterol/gamma-HCH transport system permease protein
MVHDGFTGPVGWVAQLGLAGRTLAACMVLYGAILAGRARLDLPAFAGALRQTGLSVLPAITLVAVALGLILGSQTGSLLERFDLPSLVLLSVIHTGVMELAPILVGILVAGRAGVALAVRQATLTASGEMDGLLAAGVHPLRHTVGPVLMAMLLMSFALGVWVTLVTLGATLVWLWNTAGVTPSLFLEALRQALSPGDLVVALAKPPVFALIVALLASVNGSLAGRDAGGAARAATRTMIGAVAAILLVDLAFVLAR